MEKEEKESINVLCIGDPHFKVKNVKETMAMGQALVKLLEARKPDFIVVLGDVLDRHETIHESPLSRAIFLLKKLQEYAPVYLVVGNHDRPNNSVFLTDQHPFNALKCWTNTTIVDAVHQEIIKGHLFTFVPYVYPGRFMEAIDTLYGIVKEKPPPQRESLLTEFLLATKEVVNDDGGFYEGNIVDLVMKSSHHMQLKEQEYQKQLSEPKSNKKSLPDRSIGDWKKSTCIFAHQEFKGAKMGAIISEEGDPWSLDLPLVISGHIHDYDHLQTNIIYTGTPIQHAFGDRSDKTVSWFTFNGSGGFHEERINLKLPKKIIIRVPYDQIEDTSLPENTEIKVIVIGNTSQIKTAAKLTKIKNWIKEGVKVVYRDISEIDLEQQKDIVPVRYEDLIVQTISSLPKDESAPLLKLFHYISSEIS